MCPSPVSPTDSLTLAINSLQGKGSPVETWALRKLNSIFLVCLCKHPSLRADLLKYKAQGTV